MGMDRGKENTIYGVSLEAGQGEDFFAIITVFAETKIPSVHPVFAFLLYFFRMVGWFLGYCSTFFEIYTLRGHLQKKTRPKLKANGQ